MKIHVFVATTQGLVAIQNISAIDDTDISSIVSINGTSTTANISSAYHNFVKKGAGIIQQDFGACSYRINISKRIDTGNSWQLAFYLAHAAKNENMLGDGQVKSGDQVICATGEINTSSREIQAIGEISRKQQLAAKQIKQWHKRNISVSFLVPYANVKILDKQLPLNIKLVRNLTHALTYLPLTVTANSDTSTNDKFQNNSSLKKHIKTISSTKKLTSIALLVTMLFFLVLLSMNYWFSTNVPTVENDTTQRQAHKNGQGINQATWQLAFLNIPTHGLNESLQPAYSIIENTITEQLIAENFDIADSTLLNNSNNLTKQDLSLLNQYGINLGIRFNFTVNKLDQLTDKSNTNTSTENWHYELSAYLIDLATKRKIETHTESGEFGDYSSKFINCDKQCLAQWHAKNSRKLAQDMGAILVVKLNNLPKKYHFELIFQNFLAEELAMIHKQLNEMNGFLSSKLLQKFSAKSELLHQTSNRRYSYSSYLSAGELANNLTTVFEQFGVSVIQSNNDANTLVFIRQNMPYFIYYVVSALILTGLFSFLYIVQRNRHLILTSHNEADEPITPNAVLTNDQEITKASNIIACINQKGEAIKGTVIGLGALENHIIFTSKSVTLGRFAEGSTTSFSINYQRISRVGKQCLFSYENNGFYLQDQGSINGSFFNNTLLSAQQKIHIHQDSQLILGGSNKTDIAICELQLKVTTPPSNALIMQLDNNNHQLLNLKGLELSWPSMTKDLCYRWILLAEEISLSIDNGQIQLGCVKSDAIAYLVYQDGFYIRPANITDETRQVMINQVVIHATMPIYEQAVISLDGYDFSLQTLEK
jgi:hypothetical protein